MTKLDDLRKSLHTSVDELCNFISEKTSEPTLPSPDDDNQTVPGVATMLNMVRGQTLYLPTSVVKSQESPLQFRYYILGSVQTLMPSFKGAGVGDYKDIMHLTTRPEDADLTEITAPRIMLPGVYTINSEYQVTVSSVVLPEKPLFPMYIEIESRKCLLAHNLQDNVMYQGPITQKYIDLMRSFWIEPMKQNITRYPSTNLDNWSQQKASFRQLVLDGALTDPIVFGPEPGSRPSVDVLKAIEAACPNGIIYAWDEGEGNTSATAQALDYCTWLKANTKLRIMVTRQWSAEFEPFVDIFCPVFDWFNTPTRVPRLRYTKPYALYGSCMANGNCTNKTSAADVAPATGSPMMVLDASAMDHWDYPLVAQALGAKFCLYYNSTQRLQTAFDPGGQYNEGGNGDGTLFYPGADGPIPSVRLARLHEGLQSATLIEMAKQKNWTAPAMTTAYDSRNFQVKNAVAFLEQV